MTTVETAPETRRAWLPWVGVFARLLVGGVWIAAGLLKIPDPAENVRAVRAYRLLPEAVVPTSATRCRSWSCCSGCAWSSGCWSA